MASPTNIYASYQEPKMSRRKLRKMADTMTEEQMSAFGFNEDALATSEAAGLDPAMSKESWFNTKPNAAVAGGTQLAAMASSFLPVEQNIYKFDKFSPVKGAAQGAAIGAQFGGPVGAVIGGAAGLIGGGVMEALDNRKQLKNVDTNINGYDISASGAPVYLGGNINNALSDLSEIEDSKSIFNKKLRKKAKEKLSGAIDFQQDSFNEASSSFNQEQIARDNYRARRSLTNRIYNLYS